MAKKGESSKVSFTGNPAGLAELLAPHLIAALSKLTTIEPPMSIEETAKWTGWSRTHLEELVKIKAIPYHDAALPGGGKRKLFFWKHELAVWKGTEDLPTKFE